MTPDDEDGPVPTPDGGTLPDDPDVEDVLEELEELEGVVDTAEEREQVRETMRVARRLRRPRPVGRVRNSFGSRDVGEAMVGSFLFGMPMIVEDGTYGIGKYIAEEPALILATAGFGVMLVLGILWAAEFEKVEADFLLGFVPVRVIGIVGVAVTMSVGLMTLWGTVDWSQPAIAASQSLMTAVVMAVGASLGDVLPES